MISDEALYQALGRTLEETNLPELGTPYIGKVRDNYTRGSVRTIVVTDRLSAFDVVLGTIPYKGQLLNQLSAYWFTESRALAPNHLLDVPDPNVTRAVACAPLPVEMVVRGYLTGVTSTSIWHHYSQGGRRFCGHPLPEGMHKNEPLRTPLVTPSTKAAHGGHDESVAGEELVARGLVDAATFAELSALCLRMFAFGSERARARGLLLVDTKYELGRAPDGRILFIDELHTPDSSRYWFADDYEERLRRAEEPRSLDKEYVRRYLAERGYRGGGAPPPLPDEVRVEAAKRYLTACEQLMGRSIVLDTEPPLPRIRRNLQLDHAEG